MDSYFSAETKQRTEEFEAAGVICCDVYRDVLVHHTARAASGRLVPTRIRSDRRAAAAYYCYYYYYY